MGPDLTSLTSRFSRKEILQSIVHPSHIVPSQYAAKSILLEDGRQIIGIVAPGPNGQISVLKDDGDKVSISEQDIDEILPSKISAMPTGLFNELTLKDIADLFAFVSEPPKQRVAQELVPEKTR